MMKIKNNKEIINTVSALLGMDTNSIKTFAKTFSKDAKNVTKSNLVAQKALDRGNIEDAKKALIFQSEIIKKYKDMLDGANN